MGVSLLRMIGSADTVALTSIYVVTHGAYKIFRGASCSVLVPVVMNTTTG
jgi:hypothetical protein